MNASRRNFLKTSAVAVSAAAIMPNDLFAAPKIQRVGLQLYSVRDHMKTDPAGTLKKLADMGYIYVEHANYIDRKFYGYTAPEFKKLLGGLGLVMPSGHTVMTTKDWDSAKGDFTDKWKYTIDDAATMGQKFVISPWMEDSIRSNPEELKKFMDQFNKCGELCQKSGMKFGYHTHEFEFVTKVGDKVLYEYILDNTDPKLVIQQLDIGNMYLQGNMTALDYMKKYPGRFESLHVKDEIKSQEKGEVGTGFESTYLGKGLVPVKDILKLAKQQGITSLIIEHESYQGADSLDCVKIDLQTMKKWGY
ncbi:sugar phosphate isomerase/epimerase family protein [Mucilaginibacter glaciei]|uniref:Sugar phosphate isomerase/epimerase n=1 Tax=Mucilaginibacter glaciei TaxID=2772109 RepID=A0A926S464_9SPHI|nr:sugar phosphate isomerase/epimerase [Mucilaginibacter glaciei]MBD1391481.1 sugar phosphate isomerase/epimerase [Mucilaginibacter glaciei]